MNLVSVGISEAVIFVEHHSLDADGPAIPLQHSIKRERQVGEGLDCVMRQTDAGLEEQSQHVEGRREVEVDHDGYASRVESR